MKKFTDDKLMIIMLLATAVIMSIILSIATSVIVSIAVTKHLNSSNNSQELSWR